MTRGAVVTGTPPGTRETDVVIRVPFSLSGSAVLLATDGSLGAVGAARMANALAALHHAVVHVVTIVGTTPPATPPPYHPAEEMSDERSGDALHERETQSLREVLTSTIGEWCGWPIRALHGDAADEITAEAARLKATLIVVGLRRHDLLERVIGDETVLRVMRAARCPVLGVVPDAPGLPTRVLAALDFTGASEEAAGVASGVMGETGRLTLVYVSPAVDRSPEEDVLRELGVKEAFERCVHELTRPDITIDHFVLHHQRARAVSYLLTDYADGMGSDLIAVGSARHGRLERWVMGSVSTELVRHGGTSVLVVPPRDS